MGNFIEVTAFGSKDPHKIAKAITVNLTQEGVEASVQNTSVDLDTRRHAPLYADDGDWTVVYWPRWFPYADLALGQTLSEQLSISVSHISVHDGDYWTHVFHDSGECIDDFFSVPDYWGDPYDPVPEFGGNPEGVANCLGIEVEDIRLYYRHMSVDFEYNGKAYKDDKSELEDFWVFVDFWRKLGIRTAPNFKVASLLIDIPEKEEETPPARRRVLP